MKALALSALAGYKQRHPIEVPLLEQLSSQLVDDPACMADRSNMRGHLTASCLVLNHFETHVLLIDHLVLKKWLQPGGHLDDSATLWAAASREVEEETGVGNITSLFSDEDAPLVLDIYTHAILPNPKKGEGAHIHHDFMFAAKAPANAVLKPQTAEVGAAKWVPLREVKDMPNKRMLRALGKLEAILNREFAAKLAQAQALVGKPVVITGAPSGYAGKADKGICTAVVKIPDARHADVILENGHRFGLNLDFVSPAVVLGLTMSLSPFVRKVEVQANAM